MYIKDLCPYIYMNQEPNLNILAVGWLGKEYDFPRGPVPDGTLDKILQLCFIPINQTRGFHQSPFIKLPSIGYPVEYNGSKMLLGSAEIKVVGQGGIVYLAPNLIYHYIRDCNYLPPEKFLNALRF